jgi:hypothetical protein
MPKTGPVLEVLRRSMIKSGFINGFITCCYDKVSDAAAVKVYEQ